MLAGAAIAQQDPFEAAPKTPEAARPATKAAPAAVQAQPLPLALEMLRATRPTTPAELLAAAQGALRFGRPDEAKTYLSKLLADKPEDEKLAALTAQFGNFLLQLDRTKELQPEGKEVADLILAAAERTAQNLDQIENLIKQLSNPRAGVSQHALGRLSLAGAHVVNPMLQALADPNRGKEHASIRSALVRLSAVSESPLIAALDTTNEKLKPQIVSILGRIDSTRGAASLVRLAVDGAQPEAIRNIAAAGLKRIGGAAPDSYEARKYLMGEARRYLTGDIPYDADVNGIVNLWQWDQAATRAVPLALPRGDAAVWLATRVANDLYLLNPADVAAQDLMLLTSLELAQVQAGLGQPVPADRGAGAAALRLGPQAISRVLRIAMVTGRVPAAIAAAELLGHSGETAVLQPDEDHASPLADAMTYPDRRVRLAAALSAIKLAPGYSFQGAGRISDTLAWFIGTTGADVVFIAHPHGEQAQTLVGFMNDLGLQGEAAYIGKVLAERAFASPDHPFILMTDAIDQPSVEELVQWLRRDFRTARQPIGVLTRSERLEELRNHFADDAFTLAFPRIHSAEVAATDIARLKALAGRNLVDPDERVSQAKAAFSALITLAKNPAVLAQYNLPRHQQVITQAIDNPQLAAQAIEMLAIIGNSRAQTVLVEFASQASRELSNRQAAVAALATAIRTRGLLLTQQQILLQYDRYNTSLALDRATQEVLSSIIDSLEAPAIARGELSQRE